MGRLLTSYFALGIPAGSPLTVALRRYRWLAQAFHPDRFVQSRKAAAEQEMKRINDARDTLREHFSLKHRSAIEVCECESWTKQQAHPSKPTNKTQNKSEKGTQSPATTDGSTNQSRQASLISDARRNYRNQNDPPEGDDHIVKEPPLCGSAWQRGPGTYRINRVQYADKIGSERSSNTCAPKDDHKNASKAKAQPIALSQWFLIAVALVFFTMAMAANHQSSLSLKYGGEKVESQ